MPSSPDSAEDAGVLMGYVFDPTLSRSDLVILDAQNSARGRGRRTPAGPGAAGFHRQLGAHHELVEAQASGLPRPP